MRSVLLLYLLGQLPPILLLTLALAMYLTVLELRGLDWHWKWWAWSLSLVFLTHFIGYLGLRAFVAFRRRHSARV